MAIEKYIIDKSELTALLRGEDLKIQPKGNIKGFCVEIAGNPTNRDMINALFPNAKNIRVDGGYHLSYIIEGKLHRNLKEWWNAPYKEDKRKTITREEAIKQLKKLKSFHNGSYGEAINFAIESLKVDLAYDLEYEKVDFIETPEGATNGDMIKAMFSDCKDWKATIEESDEEVYEVHFVHLPNSMTINKYEESWWNAPYKAESGDKKC